MTSALKDSDNLRRIEALRPEHDSLRDAYIRYDAELRRAERDLDEATKEAVAIAGTSDLDELRKIIKADYETNTVVVDQYESLIADLKANLAKIDVKE